MADLAAPTFTIVRGQIKIENKEDVCLRLGRSTDRGDAVVESWSAGPTYITSADDWARESIMQRPMMGRTPKVIMGRQR